MTDVHAELVAVNGELRALLYRDSYLETVIALRLDELLEGS
jgi:hypothetical protein